MPPPAPLPAVRCSTTERQGQRRRLGSVHIRAGAPTTGRPPLRLLGFPKSTLLPSSSTSPLEVRHSCPLLLGVRSRPAFNWSCLIWLPIFASVWCPISNCLQLELSDLVAYFCACGHPRQRVLYLICRCILVQPHCLLRRGKCCR